MASLTWMRDGCGVVQLEVLRTVVVPHTVAMMNRLAGLEVAAENAFGNQHVLEHVWRLLGSRMVGLADHQIGKLDGR